LALVEAFACALPLVASALGAVGELVDDGRTGLTFRASDPDDLAAKVNWAWAPPREMEQMGGEARREFEAKYTAAANYEALSSIYNQVLGQQSAPSADHNLSSPDAVGTNTGPEPARLS
jgi:glycosyltransferase involved in cell wall biosynthesis